MGEAKRRQKLDPNYGHNYPPQEDNWIFTSALLSHVAIDNQQYQLLFAQAVKTGSVFVVVDDDDPRDNASKSPKLDRKRTLEYSN